MKVIINEESKRCLTLSELPAAKQIITDLKEDDGLKEYASMAANCWLHNSDSTAKFDSVDHVLSVQAIIAKNCRAWDCYGEGTGNLDVWINAVCRTTDGYLEIGAYLTDVHGIGPEEYNAQFPEHCFTQYFTRCC